jgi:beta-mannosidase
MPHNMGSLFWQLNDCWPVASWSSIDYTGRWKALQYYARRFYSEILVSPHEENGNIDVFVVSDRLQPAAGQLNVTLLDFEGNKLWSQQKEIEVAPLTSRSYLTLRLDTVLGGKDPKGVFLFSEVLVGGKQVSSNEHFFEAYKNLDVPRPQISFDVAPLGRGLGRGFRVTLSADKFARAVYLSAPNYAAGFFADNYFDLIPGQKVQVEFRTGAAIRLSDFRSKLKIRTMADAF